MISPEEHFPGLTSERFVDPHTGQMGFRYFLKRKRVPAVPIKGRIVEQMAGYTLIHKDLRSALDWIERAEHMIPMERFRKGEYAHAKDRDTFNLVKALFVAALTFYGKCFTQAAGRRAQMARDWLAPEYRDVHDQAMTFRHNLAAHSGDKRIEKAEGYVLVHPNRRKGLPPILATTRSQPDIALPVPGERGFRELISHVMAKAQDKHDAVAQKIMDELVLPRGADFWHRAAKRGSAITLTLER